MHFIKQLLLCITRFGLSHLQNFFFVFFSSTSCIYLHTPELSINEELTLRICILLVFSLIAEVNPNTRESLWQMIGQWSPLLDSNFSHFLSLPSYGRNNSLHWPMLCGSTNNIIFWRVLMNIFILNFHRNVWCFYSLCSALSCDISDEAQHML